jgi:hypothetical protein
MLMSAVLQRKKQLLKTHMQQLDVVHQTRILMIILGTITITIMAAEMELQ